MIILDANSDKLIFSLLLNHPSSIIIAGGLGVFMHADHIRSLLPAATTYHALADSAFYPDVYNVSNNMHIRLQFQKLYNLHHIIGEIPFHNYHTK